MTTPLHFPQALTLLFIAFRLADIIDWSWWLVLMPWYGAILVSLVILWAQRVRE